MWITAYPPEALDKARRAYDPAVVAGMEAGIVALYQKCPHLGCRVPQCVTSQWFECPCHGSQYNQVGEKKGRTGAPRHGSLPRRRRGRLGDRRHRHRRPGPADRYQHHGPGSRRPPLHRSRRRRALSPANYRSGADDSRTGCSPRDPGRCPVTNNTVAMATMPTATHWLPVRNSPWVSSMRKKSSATRAAP